MTNQEMLEDLKQYLDVKLGAQDNKLDAGLGQIRLEIQQLDMKLRNEMKQNTSEILQAIAETHEPRFEA